MNPLDLSMLLGGRGSRPFIAGEGSREGGEGDRREAETLSFDALLTLMGASLHPGSPVMPPAPGPVPEAPAVEPLRPPLLAKLFHAPGEVPDREALASSVVEETASTGNASFETELSTANAEGGDLPAATNMPPRSLGVPVVWSTSRVVLAGGVPGAVLRAAMAMEDSAPALDLTYYFLADEIRKKPISLKFFLVCMQELDPLLPILIVKNKNFYTYQRYFKEIEGTDLLIFSGFRDSYIKKLEECL